MLTGRFAENICLKIVTQLNTIPWDNLIQGTYILPRGGGKNMAHNLAAGIVVLKDDKVLLVKDKSGWSLPKGSAEIGETLLKTAKRRIRGNWF